MGGLHRLRDEGIVVGGGDVVVAVEIEGFTAGLLFLGELVGDTIGLRVGLGAGKRGD